MCLWWVRPGYRPTVGEAEERLQLLRIDGPTPRAFTFKRRFDPPLPGDGRWAVAGH